MCQEQIRTDPKHICFKFVKFGGIFHERSNSLGKQSGIGKPNHLYFLRYLHQNMERIASLGVTKLGFHLELTRVKQVG